MPTREREKLDSVLQAVRALTAAGKLAGQQVQQEREELTEQVKPIPLPTLSEALRQGGQAKSGAKE